MSDDFQIVNDLLKRCEHAEAVLCWIVSLDDPDGPGFEARKSVSIAQIIRKAREAINQPEEYEEVEDLYRELPDNEHAQP